MCDTSSHDIPEKGALPYVIYLCQWHQTVSYMYIHCRSGLNYIQCTCSCQVESEANNGVNEQAYFDYFSKLGFSSTCTCIYCACTVNVLWSPVTFSPCTCTCMLDPTVPPSHSPVFWTYWIAASHSSCSISWSSVSGCSPSRVAW